MNARNRWLRIARIFLAMAALAAWLAPGPGARAPRAQGRDSTAAVPSARALVLERVELEGNTRTDPATALDRVDLRAGAPLDPSALHEAAETLRAQLFREVEVHTRPGSEPGRVVAVFRVKENRPRVRFGAGYDDFSGWYLTPVRLDLDNLTGHGETLGLDARVGYRVGGVGLRLRSVPEALPRPYWEVRLRAEGQDRVYFHDGTELNQKLNRSGVELGFGAPLPHRFAVAATLGYETAEPDSQARVYQDHEELDRHKGDRVPFEDLPAAIRDDLGRRKQGRFGVALAGDGRRGQGLLTSGMRGRLHTEAVVSAGAPFYALGADARGYASLGHGLQAAARLRAALVTEGAPFYERLYLGGLYTVRGYASQSLSPPDGNLRMGTASMELRSTWVGPPRDPRVAGILFADAGWAGNHEAPRLDDVAVGIGYGLRVRVPWVQQVGLDVGIPLSSGVLDEAFHINVSLGWTY